MSPTLQQWIRLLYDLWTGDLSAIYARRTEQGDVYVEIYEGSNTQKYAQPEEAGTDM